MDKRSVMIAFPGAAKPEEVQSSAATWGELKQELKDQLGQEFHNQKVRDHKTNHHYNDDAAQLPAEPLKLLVSTDKNKSGGVTKANYHKAGFSDLRTFAKKMTGFAPNGKQACIDALDKHYGKTSPKAATPAKATSKKEAATSKKGATTTEKVGATAKASSGTGSVEKRLKKLEEAVFGKPGVKDDDFLRQARNLS